MHWRWGSAQPDAQLLGPWLKDEAFTFYTDKIFHCEDFCHKLQWIDASAFKKNAMEKKCVQLILSALSSTLEVKCWSHCRAVHGFSLWGVLWRSQTIGKLMHQGRAHTMSGRSLTGAHHWSQQSPMTGVEGRGYGRDLRSEWGNQQKRYWPRRAFISLAWFGSHQNRETQWRTEKLNKKQNNGGAELSSNGGIWWFRGRRDNDCAGESDAGCFHINGVQLARRHCQPLFIDAHTQHL